MQRQRLFPNSSTPKTRAHTHVCASPHGCPSCSHRILLSRVYIYIYIYICSSLTQGSKPYLVASTDGGGGGAARAASPRRSSSPSPPDRTALNWNFNVSHEGRYVILASEPLALCGVDVAAPGQVKKSNKRKSARSCVPHMCDEHSPPPPHCVPR